MYMYIIRLMCILWIKLYPIKFNVFNLFILKKIKRSFLFILFLFYEEK
jgi:hypothetical protein